MAQQTASIWGLGVDDLPTKSNDIVNHDHLNNTNPQDIIDLKFEPLGNQNVSAILDMTNITQDTIFILLVKANGADYEEILRWEWTLNNDDITNKILKLVFEGFGVDAKVTMQSVTAERTNKSVLGRKTIYNYS